MSKRCVLELTVGIALAIGWPAPAWADLSVDVQATESLMNSEGLFTTLIAADLGVDPHPLSFNSVVDVASKTYGYSLASGSTYLGQPASLQVSAAFDGASQSWLWTSTGQIGSIDLAGHGSTKYSGDPQSLDVFVTISLPITTITNVTYDSTAIRTVSSGTITVTDTATLKTISTGKHTDDLILTGPNKGKWKWDTGAITGLNGTFALSAQGFSPIPDGGLGTFTMNVTAVPEPSTLVSAGLVLSGFLIYRVLAGVGRGPGMGVARLHPFRGDGDRGSV